jgi:hypothetical protein
VRRSGGIEKIRFLPFARDFLNSFAEKKKNYVQAQYLSTRRAFERGHSSGVHEATYNQIVLDEFEGLWSSEETRLAIIPGKEALSAINGHLQSTFGVNITPTSVVDAMSATEIPKEMKLLVADLAVFSSGKVVDLD